jgi:hypothetical protein
MLLWSAQTREMAGTRMFMRKQTYFMSGENDSHDIRSGMAYLEASDVKYAKGLSLEHGPGCQTTALRCAALRCAATFEAMQFGFEMCDKSILITGVVFVRAMKAVRMSRLQLNTSTAAVNELNDRHDLQFNQVVVDTRQLSAQGTVFICTVHQSQFKILKMPLT